MFGEYRKPRWIWLYLVLPLTLILFWLVRRINTSMTGHRLLEIGVMLFVWTYVEAWQRLNLMALMHRPFPGFNGWPLYREREALPPRGAARPAPLGSFYSDLFATPISVWDSEPGAASPESVGRDGPTRDKTVEVEGSRADG